MDLEEQLRDLIDLAPPHIQRHFACDCVERSLRHVGEISRQSWKAIEVSRRFAEGKATPNELKAAMEAAWPVAMEAARDAARAAARAAAWSAAREEERKWQITHLQSMISNHNTTRSSLLLVLQQRAESIKPIFAQYAHDLEERAFE